MKAMKRSRKMLPSARRISRREFAVRAGLGMTAIAVAGNRVLAQDTPRSSLALARNPDRGTALREALDLLGDIHYGGKDIYLKANFTSADPFPATTHPETLRLVAGLLRERHCGKLVLVERSSMGSTRDVWEALGIPSLARELGIELLALDELAHMVEPFCAGKRTAGQHCIPPVSLTGLMRGNTLSAGYRKRPTTS